ncbi:MAG: hypothetical protein V7765_21260 [Oleispira sp.]
MTASQRAKQGGLNVATMAVILDYSRPHLHTIFNDDPKRFDLMLIDAMRKKCEMDIVKLKSINNLEG